MSFAATNSADIPIKEKEVLSSVFNCRLYRALKVIRLTQLLESALHDVCSLQLNICNNTELTLELKQAY